MPVRILNFDYSEYGFRGIRTKIIENQFCSVKINA